MIESKSDVELGNFDGSFAGKHLTKQAYRETERMLEPDREAGGNLGSSSPCIEIKSMPNTARLFVCAVVVCKTISSKSLLESEIRNSL